ncbi:MAG: hypothetical protein CMK74_12205 [Pseudomonadales bacterium]|nr:hypothetical protein [Pseudomonadales bacterium]|tara:strand:+ start:1946 stop:2824 length:879 start_codon:yes stop_codon:yes gene_type:complete
MGAFLEERLDVCMRIGAEAADSYMLEASTTLGGSEYVWLINGKPYREFDVGYIKRNSDLADSVLSLYHRTYGGYAGFRVKSWDDFTTALDGRSAYSATDCTLDLVSDGVYQLVKEYGRDKPALPDIGRPRRALFKPVAGEVAVSVAGQVLPSGQWSVDTTTGRVTLAANKSRAIIGITKAAQAVLTVGTNTFLIGDSVAISAVVGMTQINNLRALVTAKPSSTEITVAIDSTAFSTYVSGGTVQTRPLAGEVVAGGCEFDIPCRFSSAFSVTALDPRNREVANLSLRELLDP